MFRLTLAAALMVLAAPAAQAFCGFYVAKADTTLFNQASKVVLTRQDDRTVITMASDYQGDPTEFALVVPVPTVITEGQVNVAEPKIVDHLDAYTAPRLVEYHDPNPCAPPAPMSSGMLRGAVAEGITGSVQQPKATADLGVTIEAEYSVGEYDILVLSAQQSDGLVTWLDQNGYRMPAGAGPVLATYLKQGMKFFVAKVNLKEHQAGGRSYLRPIQVAYESPKFMLPIRLGTVNANGPQDLFIFALSSRGRVETTNYRTVKLPSNFDVPIFVKEQFGEFYRDMFTNLVKERDMRAVFLEYAWDMGWCDPCAADPLPNEDLITLGAFWLIDQQGRSSGRMGPRGVGQNVFVTRLHLRYTAETFPEDLVLQETADRENWQGRYVLRHPYTGSDRCPAYKAYAEGTAKRMAAEATQLARLTGWSEERIQTAMARNGLDPATFRARAGEAPAKGSGEWWEQMWQRR